MNLAKLAELADIIEDHLNRKEGLTTPFGKVGFNMGDWISSGDPRNDKVDACGTVGCLAGWAALVWQSEKATDRLDRPGAISDLASNELDLDWGDRENLFAPHYFVRFRMSRERNFKLTLADITAKEAIRTLRYAAQTGEIDWIAANFDFIPKASQDFLPVPEETA